MKLYNMLQPEKPVVFIVFQVASEQIVSDHIVKIIHAAGQSLMFTFIINYSCV